MPVKHQINSYRTRGGVRYLCWGDYATIDEARRTVAWLRADGKQAFYISRKAWGYARVFTSPKGA